MSLPEFQSTKALLYLAKIAGETVTLPETQDERWELFLANIAGEEVTIPTDLRSREELFLAKWAGASVNLSEDSPRNRIEHYLMYIMGESETKPEYPETELEVYLDAIEYVPSVTFLALPYLETWNKPDGVFMYGKGTRKINAACNTKTADIYYAAVVENDVLQAIYYLSTTRGARVFSSEYYQSADTLILGRDYYKDGNRLFSYYQLALEWSQYTLGDTVTVFSSNDDLLNAFVDFFES